MRDIAKSRDKTNKSVKNRLSLQSSWLVKKLATPTWPLLTKEMKVVSHSEVITALTVKFPCVSSKPVLVTWLSSV